MDGHDRDDADVRQTATVEENNEEEDEEIKSKAATDSFLDWEDDVGFEFGTKVPRTPGLSRYKKGLKNAFPVRFVKSPKGVLPLETNGFINYMTFGWLSPYMWQVFRKGIQPLRGLQITKEESSEVSAQRMERFWSEELAEKGEKEASFGRAVYKSFKTRIIIGAIANLLYAFLSLANPMLVIRYFLDYLTEDEVTVKTGIIYAVILGVNLLLRGLVGAFFWMLNYEAGARIKYGSLALLYRKVLHVKTLKDKTVGDIVNIISNDGQRIWDGIVMGPFIIGGPMILIMGCVYSVIYLGPWTLVSFLVLIGFYPYAVGLMNELLTYIKLIKMYAWEISFAKKISELREEEKRILEKCVFAQSVSMGSSVVVPILASCVTFIAYVATGNNLTATQAFTFVSLLNTMQASMMTIPFALRALSEMVVTTRRLQEFLVMEEMGRYPQKMTNSSSVVEMTNASFSWGVGRVKKEMRNGTNGKIKHKKKKKQGGVPEEEQTLSENHLTEGSEQIFVGPTIRNLTLNLQRGQLIGVCGNVGSGKSSLISAILGRMDVTSGTVAVSGRIAYVSQQAWVTNDTLQDNILFGSSYEADRYKQIVEACALSVDFSTFPAGDATEVGERGANLSGGQKQRISLARAAYSKNELVLLDDPLSAVDVHVGHHIYQQCIRGLLKGRSVIFVTHKLQYLKECDNILVMKDGQIAEQGSHDQLLASGGEYANLLRLYSSEDEQGTGVVPEQDEQGEVTRISEIISDEDITNSSHGEQILVNQNMNLISKETKEGDEINVSGHAGVKGNEKADALAGCATIENGPLMDKTDIINDVRYIARSKDISDENNDFSLNRLFDLVIPIGAARCLGKLISEEKLDTGALQLPVVHKYILAMGGYLILLLVFLCFSLPVVGVTTAGWYLSYWLEQGGGNTTSVQGNLTVPSNRVIDHPDLEFYMLIYAAFIPVLIITTLLRSFSLMKATLRASSHLHDTGFMQILRCPMSFFDATPVGRIVNRFSADLDEIDVRLPMNVEVFLTNVLQVIASLAMIGYVSPWFLLAAIPLGVFFFSLMIVFHVCIRQLKCLDNITRSPVISHIGMSVQGLTCIYAYRKTGEFVRKHCQLLNANSVAVFLFYAANRWLALRLDLVSAGVGFFTALLIVLTYDQLNPALAGLALSYSVQMSGLFQFTARLAVETEARFTSVQRILEYCDISEKEMSVTSTNNQLAKDWPRAGAINFCGVRLRYKSGLPLALKDITFNVESHEKIGIVGRSGAGKSSLTVALFRLTELEAGKILVDDVDISKVSLDELRSRLSIIPQDPVLFAGNLRYNLDPFQQYSDADVWQALEKCHIASMVKSLKHQLDTSVVENGDNFSVGERQLICMARALLRNSRILVLDEATAAIDSETDALIQQTLKEAFSDCTMLIIAHRINTVRGCNKILVMEEGMIKEFDTPSSLLSNPLSKFKTMYDADISTKSDSFH